ncbi:MAG TPA: response regulator [Mucilaginibacter sp.]
MPGTVLLVEDDPDVLDILYYILADAGYQVTRSDGHDVMHRIAELPPGLILLDHRLQVAWGADICRRLKNSESTRAIPVIMMSATMYLEETAKTAGADDHLAKPFDLEDLLNKVGRHLQTNQP